MTNKYDASNIISTVDFNKLAVGNLTSLKDQNSTTNYTWTPYPTTIPVVLDTTTNTNYLNFSTTSDKLYLSFTESIKTNNFFVELDVQFNTKVNNTLFCFSGSSLNFYITLSNKNNGFSIRVGTTNSIVFPYLFEPNTRYVIGVSKNYNTFTLYVNGKIIATKTDVTFNNTLTTDTQYYVVGSTTYATSADTYAFSGRIYSFNISFGPYIKYSTQYTTYGDQLVGRVNYNNIGSNSNVVLLGNITTTATISNSKVTVTSFNYNLKGKFTVFTGVTPRNASNESTLFNWSDTYKLNLKIIKFNNDPEVIVNEYTTSALDFENGIIDKVGTTIWNKEGTASVTSVNKIFGENSFETKALGDSLYTNSKIITGGSTPFTIEFYALIKGSSDGGIYKSLLSKVYDGPYAGQGFTVTNNNRIQFQRQEGSGSPILTQAGIYNKSNNEIIKYTFTYDGSALRIFHNDKLDLVAGTPVGFYMGTDQPMTFMSLLLPSAPVYNSTTYGLIDNINIYDGIATKVRDPDPYEDYLVVDLAFDGENNSTKIVDNARLTERNSVKYNDNVVSLIRFDNNKVSDEVGMTWNKVGSPQISDTIYKFGSSINISPSNYLKATHDSIFDLAAHDDFTIEMFINIPINMPEYQDNEIPLIANGQQNASNIGGGWDLTISDVDNASIRFEFCTTTNTAPSCIAYMPRLSRGVWHHIAVTRYNGLMTFFINGISIGESNNLNNIALINPNKHPILIGSGSAGTSLENYYKTNIYMEELRFIKGKSIYIENFTVPNKPFDYVKHKRWIVNSNAKVSTTQKFDGFSSLYLDSNGSYLSTYANSDFNFTNIDATIKFDFYPLNTNTSYNILFSSGDMYRFVIHPTNKTIYCDLNPKETTNSILINQNNTFCVLFYSHNQYFDMYLNGVMTRVPSINLQDFSINTFCIGHDISLPNNTFKGYIKNFKIYKGVAVIPEDPTGKIQLDFDNNVNDKYGNSTWTNNGVTFDQVNSVKGYSAYFSGNESQSIYLSQNSNLNFENKNFIIETDFMSLNVNKNYGTLLGTGHTSIPSSGVLNFSYGVIDGISFSKQNGFKINTQNILNNQYYNTSINRLSDTLHLRLNDVIVSSLPINSNEAINYSDTGTRIGNGGWYDGDAHQGYIDNFKTYKEDLTSNLDIYSTSASNSITTTNNALKITTITSNGMWSKFKDIPFVKNFKCNINFERASGDISFIFRTTSWTNTNDTFAYIVNLSGTTLALAKGSNSTTSSFAWLTTATFNNNVNTNYKLTVVFNETSILIYINDALIINYSDSTYNIAGQIGFRSYGDGTTIFKDITIYDLQDNLIYSNNFKSKIDNVIDRPAVHLPLETNAINTGFSSLTINSVGNPTYTTVDGKKCIKFESGKYLTIDSNNIFNLGTSSDFYIEFDIYVEDITPTNWQRIFCINSTNTQYLYLRSVEYGDGYLYYSNTKLVYKTYLLNKWTNIKIIRINDKVFVYVDDVEFAAQNSNYVPHSTISIGTDSAYSYQNSDYLRGYMSNFKMFVGTSEIPETYNDKKVLDLDFKPTNKSYLFKDNNNKCVIHPVNITQRDYQNSQYCCTFNGVDQYLQLGKNELFNFGNDDFVIDIEFEFNNITSSYKYLLSSATISNTENGTCGIAIDDNYKFFIYIKSAAGLFICVSVDTLLINTYYKATIIRSNNNLKVYINDKEIELIIVSNIISDINFNTNNNTYIGKSGWDPVGIGFFNKHIYSIKVLRNTTDLTLLDTDQSNLPTSVTYELTNGTDITTIDYTEVVQKDLVITKSDTTVSAKIGTDILEVPTIDETLLPGDISMFTNYTGTVNPEIDIYNDVIESDSFNGITLVETDISDIVVEVTNDNEYLVEYIGDYTINGFIEGKENHIWRLINIENSVTYATGIGDYYFYGINPVYINSFKIIDETDNKEYRLTSTNYTRGQLIISLNANVCNDSDFCLKLFRRSMNEHIFIGTYEIVNNICTINNLFVEERYDVMLFDRNTNIESRMMSDRTPIAY